MKKTSGLTMAQFGAYDRLIDWCYANEQPVDPDEVYTITHAQTPADRRDVDKVLAKFFTLEESGFRQERIEEVIAEALPKIEAARENGKKGGRPKRQTQTKPTGLFDETKSEPNAKTSQSQNSSSLRSEEKQRASRLPKPFSLPDEWADWARTARPDLDPTRVAEKFADFWHGKPGKAGTKLDWLATWRNWIREERAPPSAASETPYQRSMREKYEQATPAIAAKRPGAAPAPNPMDVLDGLTRITC